MKGYRTIIFSVLVTLVGVLQAVDWATIIPSADVAGIVIAGIGLASAVLRWLTTTPVGGK